MTRTGGPLRDHPVLLCQHVVERVVGGPEDWFTRTATALVLVAAAAGRNDGEQLAEVVSAAGWSGRSRSGVHRCAVTAAAGHVTEVLDVVGGDEGRRQVTSTGRGLARAAFCHGSCPPRRCASYLAVERLAAGSGHRSGAMA